MVYRMKLEVNVPNELLLSALADKLQNSETIKTQNPNGNPIGKEAWNLFLSKCRTTKPGQEQLSMKECGLKWGIRKEELKNQQALDK